MFYSYVFLDLKVFEINYFVHKVSDYFFRFILMIKVNWWFFLFVINLLLLFLGLIVIIFIFLCFLLFSQYRSLVLVYTLVSLILLSISKCTFLKYRFLKLISRFFSIKSSLFCCIHPWTLNNIGNIQHTQYLNHNVFLYLSS